MKINTFQDSKQNKLALLALHGWTGDEFSMEAIANETGPLSANGIFLELLIMQILGKVIHGLVDQIRKVGDTRRH